MKRLIVLLFISAFVFTGMAQTTAEQELLYRQKVESFNKMTNIGTALTVGGIVSGVTGIVLLATVPYETISLYEGEDYPEGFGKLVGGIIVAAVGVEMLAGGIVLKTIGNRKMKQYQGKLNLGLVCHHETKGLKIFYRF